MSKDNAEQLISSPHVYQAIAAVAGELAQDGITKDKTAQGYKFRGIDDVYNALAPIISKHKLVIIPRCVNRSVVERQTRNGNAIFYVTVQSEFDFISAVDGSKHTACTFGEAMDTSDKATNKAMSAAYKYVAFQAFCIPTEAVDSEVDDHKPIAENAKKEPTEEQVIKEIDLMIEQAGAANEAEFLEIVKRMVRSWRGVKTEKCWKIVQEKCADTIQKTSEINPQKDKNGNEINIYDYVMSQVEETTKRVTGNKGE